MQANRFEGINSNTEVMIVALLALRVDNSARFLDNLIEDLMNLYC